MFLAVGGCGYAGKCADEIGRIAANLAATGEWSSNIPREAMEVKWRLKTNDENSSSEEETPKSKF